MDIAIIEKIINYNFNDKSLLQLAFTHSSFSEFNYERLELLGDSVLGMIVCEYLYKNYPTSQQGTLTKVRANVVDKPPLKKIIVKLGLNKFLLIGKGEKASHLENSEKLCGDLYESILGAIYLDGGFNSAKQFVLSTLEQTIIDAFNNKKELTDYKSQLLEYCQKNKLEWDFNCSKTGEDHKPVFKVELLINNKVISSASGTSKKKAEQTACKIALNKI